MTAPHFWNADENLVTQMNGVKPDRELHDTFLDIEPITGVALSAHKRIQVFHLATNKVQKLFHQRLQDTLESGIKGGKTQIIWI